MFNKASTNTTQHIVKDVWVDLRNVTKSNVTSTNFYEDNFLPNIPVLGGKVASLYFDAHNDWELDTDFSWVDCNSSTSVCEFQACVDRRFRTNDTQDWQLNNAFMQTFGSYGYFTTYNTATNGTSIFNETRGTVQGFSNLVTI